MAPEDKKEPYIIPKSIAKLNTDYLCQDNNFVIGIGGADIIQFDEQKFKRNVEANTIAKISQLKSGWAQVLDNPIYYLWVALRNVSNYFAGEFIPSTKDEDFLADILEIWPTLVDKWYFGECYLAYGEQYLKAERAAFSRQTKKDWWDSSNFPRSKFRIYIKEGTGKFKSVFTNISGLNLDPEELVYCSCSSLNFFLQWVRIWLDWFTFRGGYINAFRASIKQNLVKLAQTEASFEHEQEQLLDLEVFLTKKTLGSHEQNIYKQYPFFPIGELLTLWKAGQVSFDYDAKWLGMYPDNMSNDNDHDRVTMGEHVQAMKMVDNVQMFLFNSLKVVFMRMKRIFKGVPEDLEVITNKMEIMQGLYNTPNSNPEMTGQNPNPNMQNNI